MIEVLFEATFSMIIGFGLIFLFSLMAALFYDIRQTKVVHRKQKISPHITVIINNQSSYNRTIRALQSVGDSTYSNFDIVLLDNLSGYADLSAYRTWNRQSRATVKIYFRRKVASLDTAVIDAYKRGNKAEIVMVLDSIDEVGPDVLWSVARHFDHYPSTLVARMNNVTAGNEGLVGVIATLDDAIQRVTHKISTLIRFKATPLMQSGYCFRQSMINKKARNTKTFIAYMSRTVRVVEPNPAYGRRLRFRGLYSIPGAVIVVTGLSYLIVTAINGSGIESLILYWIIVIACVLTLVLVDATLTRLQKIEMLMFFGIVPFITIITILFKRIPAK